MTRAFTFTSQCKGHRFDLWSWSYDPACCTAWTKKKKKRGKRKEKGKRRTSPNNGLVQKKTVVHAALKLQDVSVSAAAVTESHSQDRNLNLRVLLAGSTPAGCPYGPPPPRVALGSPPLLTKTPVPAWGLHPCPHLALITPQRPSS